MDISVCVSTVNDKNLPLFQLEKSGNPIVMYSCLQCALRSLAAPALVGIEMHFANKRILTVGIVGIRL